MRSGERDGKNATREVDVSELIQRIRNEITNSEARLRQHVTSEIRGLATILRGREVSSIDKTRLASDIESPVQPRSDYSQPEPGGRSNQKSDGPSTIVESPTEEICRLYQDGAEYFAIEISVDSIWYPEPRRPERKRKRSTQFRPDQRRQLLANTNERLELCNSFTGRRVYARPIRSRGNEESVRMPRI